MKQFVHSGEMVDNLARL